MQNPALSIAAALTGGGGAGTGTSGGSDNVQLVAADTTTSLSSNQWPWLAVAIVVGFLFQKGKKGLEFGNIFGWILIVGSALIIIAATVGIGNAMNFFGDIFAGIGTGFTWFGNLLKNSSS